MLYNQKIALFSVSEILSSCDDHLDQTVTVHCFSKQKRCQRHIIALLDSDDGSDADEDMNIETLPRITASEALKFGKKASLCNQEMISAEAGYVIALLHSFYKQKNILQLSKDSLLLKSSTISSSGIITLLFLSALIPLASQDKLFKPRRNSSICVNSDVELKRPGRTIRRALFDWSHAGNHMTVCGYSLIPLRNPKSAKYILARRLQRSKRDTDDFTEDLRGRQYRLHLRRRHSHTSG
ncbi:hypothetical protein PAAG_12033 [Paracoccidioides lutzii Pb01]|uniref:Uncharacterized protein n=1 Tax=Paracoccidioides lutzii (strain ATCC MYA-826 / Pb01) TaxID=502779 RepID=A0A0A2V4I6_PARBA|nr:hypothetical protein PAAG_12033 [Paracoccidioides lutzii Pb01]KGQ01262.1 hypothetical protein PAAG_12033 [Paracoccidioides lutzii Pb01]